MKAFSLTIGGISACIVFSLQAYGQADVAGPFNGHEAQSGFYVGWDNSTQSAGHDLQIRHDAARPITFHTQGSERMRINAGNGFVGIGDNFAAPQNRQHLHEPNTATSVFTQYTTGTTGSGSPTAGLRIGIANRSIGAAFQNIPFAEVCQSEDAPIVLMTARAERMRVMGSTNYSGLSS